MGGQGILVSGNVVTNGFDRSISLDVYPERNNTAVRSRNVSVFGNYLGNNEQGSCVGVAGSGGSQEEDRGYCTVANNVGFGPHKALCRIGYEGRAQNVGVRDSGRSVPTSGVEVNVEEAENVVVANNELYDYTNHGINVDGGVAEVTVANNLVSDVGFAGVRVAGQHATVTGNSVVRPGRQGISLEQARFVDVSGNRIREANWAGIAVRHPTAAPQHQIHGNYVHSWDREGAGTAAIVVDAGGNTVRDNFVRNEGGNGPAIEDRTDGGGNVYADNHATGDDPWRIHDPSATVRDLTPPIDVHRGRTDDDRDNVVRTTFERPYEERPALRFGDRGGGVRGVEYTTDSRGNYVGVAVRIADAGGRIDLFVGD